MQVKGVSCLGRCNEAPAVAVNGHIYSDVSQNQVEAMIANALAGVALPKHSSTHDRVSCASDPYPEGQRYGALKRLVESRDWTGTFATLKAAGLRGLGGAGFPTESKWQLVRQASGTEKYIVCNADESEPGTFKDRFILTHLPHLVIEGMISRQHSCRRAKRILYVPHEYEEQGRDSACGDQTV